MPNYVMTQVGYAVCETTRLQSTQADANALFESQ